MMMIELILRLKRITKKTITGS